MLARKTHATSQTSIPESLRQQIKNALASLYESQLKKDQKTFEVFGEIYPEELIMAASYLDEKRPWLSPVTYIISADINQSSYSDIQINTMIDSIAIFFDHYFSQKEWDEYQPLWQETSIKKQIFYFKVTRENIGLSQLADELLKKD